MLAGCLMIWRLILSNHFASYLRTRCANLAANLAFPKALLGATHFRGRGLPFAFRAISRLKSWIFCGRLMRFILMKFVKPAFMMISGRLLLFYCQSKPLV